MMNSSCAVIAWHNPKQLEKFLAAWGLKDAEIPEWLILSQDKGWKSCAKTKNLGIDLAVKRGAKTIVVIDDDMFPYGDIKTLWQVVEAHEKALEPQPVEMFVKVTDPVSRGTPYDVKNRCVVKPVAANMGYWAGVPDWSAISQIVYGETQKMEFLPQTVYGRMAAISGMNLAFKAEFLPWAYFIDVDRYDDVWMGFLLCKEAFRRDHCINFGGPVLWHSRQSDKWRNFAAEVSFQQANETLWRTIWKSKETEYEELRKLLPI